MICSSEQLVAAFLRLGAPPSALLLVLFHAYHTGLTILCRCLSVPSLIDLETQYGRFGIERHHGILATGDTQRRGVGGLVARSLSAYSGIAEKPGRQGVIGFLFIFGGVF